jgi:hypothetical protein
MNKKYRKLKIMLIAAIAIAFSGIYASADGGKGYRHHGGMHQGQGWHQRDFGGPGCAAMADLSEDETKKLDAERTEFFEATKGLRRKIYQKRLELASELAKENPDAAVASGLQKEVSDFKAQMAQKRLEHILRVQKINPDLGRGYWGGGPMGSGMMHRGMMGPGGKSHRGSYNCPMGGSGGGCGMGRRMMHHGVMESSNCPYGGPGGGYGKGSQMMHRGGGYGMGPDCVRGPDKKGPGGSGFDCPRQYKKEQGAQTE